MTLSRSEAIAQISFFQLNYLPLRPDFLQTWIAVIDADIARGNTNIEESMQFIIPGMIGAAGQYQMAFPSHPVDMWAINNREAYALSITSTELVQYFYPEASSENRNALINSLEDSTITSTDFLTGWLQVATDNPAPAAAEVLTAVFDAGLGTPALAEIDLGFAGITDTQTEFLIGIYVAAFDRAPEHTGLAYWANDLATLLSAGMAEPDTMKQMAKAMYVSGEHNGEQGTHLGHAEYVRFVYDTVLGREPDPGGAGYWMAQLHAGAPRSELIAVFLTSALQDAGDGEYVKARVAVAEFAAQAHVSGPGVSIDLERVLDGVATTADAYLAIQALASAHPLAGTLGEDRALAALTGWQDDLDAPLAAFASEAEPYARVSLDPNVADEIQLVGVKETSDPLLCE